MLPNLRKLIASDLTGTSLKGSPIYEVPLDRIYALGTADSLGACLWRLKYAHDAKAYTRTVALLSLRAKSMVPTFLQRNKFVKLVLYEWLDENCHSCGGRRYIMATESSTKHVCTVCDGTGLRQISDQWRMRKMGIDAATYQKWERKFAALHQVIADSDIRTWRDVALQLGWLDGGVEEQEMLAKQQDRVRIHSVRADDAGPNSNDIPESLVSSATG